MWSRSGSNRRPPECHSHAAGGSGESRIDEIDTRVAINQSDRLNWVVRDGCGSIPVPTVNPFTRGARRGANPRPFVVYPLLGNGCQRVLRFRILWGSPCGGLRPPANSRGRAPLSHQRNSISAASPQYQNPRTRHLFPTGCQPGNGTAAQRNRKGVYYRGPGAQRRQPDPHRRATPDRLGDNLPKTLELWPDPCQGHWVATGKIRRCLTLRSEHIFLLGADSQGCSSSRFRSNPCERSLASRGPRTNHRFSCNPVHISSRVPRRRGSQTEAPRPRRKLRQFSGARGCIPSLFPIARDALAEVARQVHTGCRFAGIPGHNSKSLQMS